MVKGAWLGFDVAAIAAWSGRTPRTVRRWLMAFRAGGITALVDAPRPDRWPKADAAYRAVLDRLVEIPPRQLGLRFDVWTSARLSAYLADQTGTRVAPGWLRALLHRQRFARGRIKHTLGHRQDPDEVAARVTRLTAAEKRWRPTRITTNGIVEIGPTSKPTPSLGASGTDWAAADGAGGKDGWR
jgi:transposase